MQDAAVLEIFELVERIDAAEQRHVLLRTVGVGDFRRKFLARPQAFAKAVDRHLLIAFEAESRPGRAVLERAGQDTHADEIRAMDAFKAFGDDGADAEDPLALPRPVPRRAVAVFGPGDDDER